MYVEYKGDGLAGSAYISRVKFSQTGRSVYFGKRTAAEIQGLQSEPR
jgi:hypothetical protein